MPNPQTLTLLAGAYGPALLLVAALLQVRS